MGEAATSRLLPPRRGRLNARAEADAEAGLDSDGLNIGAKLLVAVGGLTAALNRLEVRQRALDALIPVAVDFAGGLSSAASGSLVVKLNPGGPPAGYVWHVRRITVTGSLASGAPGGTCFVFAGMNPYSAVGGDYGSPLKDSSTTAFPVSAFYDDYQMTVSYPNQLYIIIGGAITASTFYGVTGTAKMVKDHGPGVIAYQE